MGSTCVVGLHWGDEARGKIIDLLCDQHDVVVRYQGGANAGHTVVVGGTTYKLSLVPTGILRQGIDCVIGNGVVIHSPAWLKEIGTLSSQGIDVGQRVHISDRAHVILPWSDLPSQARKYVELLGRLVGVPVTIDSVGPERLETILLS